MPLRTPFHHASIGRVRLSYVMLHHEHMYVGFLANTQSTKLHAAPTQHSPAVIYSDLAFWTMGPESSVPEIQEYRSWFRKIPRPGFRISNDSTGFGQSRGLPKLLPHVQKHEVMLIEVRIPHIRRPYSMRAALQDLEVEAVRRWWSDGEV
jgi:hypothetical protein